MKLVSIIISFIGFFVVTYIVDKKLRTHSSTYVDTLRRNGLL